MITRAQQTVILGRDEGRPVGVEGSVYRLKASSESIGGAFCVVEAVIQPGPGSAPPPLYCEVDSGVVRGNRGHACPIADRVPTRLHG